MDSQLTPEQTLLYQATSPNKRTTNANISGISLSQSNINSRSIQDLSSLYRDTTFGTSKRMHIPVSNKIGFIAPSSSLDNKLGVIPRSNRKIQLSDYGVDSPSSAKYDSL